MALREKFQELSWSNVVHKLEAPRSPYENSSETITESNKTGHTWSNADLDPTKPAFRTWTWLHYTSFWLASSFATGTWTTGSAMIALGMPWYAAWLAVVVSHIIGAVLLVGNGRGPAAYHIGFPVYARASFGMWGSYFPIASRCIVVRDILLQASSWSSPLRSLMLTFERRRFGLPSMHTMEPILSPSAFVAFGRRGRTFPTIFQPPREQQPSCLLHLRFSGS